MIVLPALSFTDGASFNEDFRIDAGSYVFRDEAILGTRMQIHLVARNFSDAQAAALNARTEIDRLNCIFNARALESELYALNRARTHRASPELFEVVWAAERWRNRTAGAFSGRLGRVIDCWRNAHNHAPSRIELAYLASVADGARLFLDEATRTITRPDEVVFALDALAKGWIVDRAFEVARASPGISGALIDIGGDIRCGGRAPDGKGWRVGIPDAAMPADNARLLAVAHLSDHAVATSGRGPRDRIIDGVRYSPTLSPRNGWPIEHAVSVTAAATSTADADAIATALLVMPSERALAWADRYGVAARVQTNGEAHWTHAARSRTAQFHFMSVKTQTKAKPAAANSWPKDWLALITFTAPPRQLVRDETFRSPYLAVWITDLDDKPVRTLTLVGTRVEWQKDNYIWWTSNSDSAEKMCATRSMSTSGSGVYKMLWDGIDDQGNPVPGGKYVLHVETSRERGKHTHRSLTLDFTQGRTFSDEIPSTEEAGGLRVNFYHP